MFETIIGLSFLVIGILGYVCVNAVDKARCKKWMGK